MTLLSGTLAFKMNNLNVNILMEKPIISNLSNKNTNIIVIRKPITASFNVSEFPAFPKVLLSILIDQ